MGFSTLKMAVLLLASLSLMLQGCSSDDEAATSGSSTSLTVAGSIASGSSKPGVSFNVSAFAVSDLVVRCVTLSGTPKAGEGSVGADGAFELSITLSAGESSQLGCFLLDSTQNNSIVATMAFDTGSTGMGGSSAQSGSVAGNAGEAINFGAITYDPDKGTAVVQAANISRSGAGSSSGGVNEGTWSDPTGVWMATCKGLEDGYDCPSEAVNNQFPLYLDQVYAKDDQNEMHKGLAIWESQDRYTSCGSTENLDAILPAGWSSTDADGNAHSASSGNNTDFSFSNVPALTAVSQPNWGESTTTCGHTYNSGETCNDVVNAGNWGNGVIGGNFTDADCKHICLADALWDWADQESCSPELSVNHGYLQSVSSAGDVAALVGGMIGGAFPTSGNAYINVNADEVEGRHVIGELILNGDSGSLNDTNSWTETICVGDNGNGACNSYNCEITENVRITIDQESASSASIEVVIQMKLDETNSDAECSQNIAGNFLYEELQNRSREMFLLDAEKQ